MKTNETGDIRLPYKNLKVLGELKNGKSMTVEIPETAVELYVVFDKMFPQKFHSRCAIGPASNDLTLNTFPMFHPFKGNPFILSPKDKMTKEDKFRLGEEVSSNQQGKMNKVIYYIVMIIAVIVGAVIGWNVV